MASNPRGAIVGGSYGAMLEAFEQRERPHGRNRCRGMELGEAGAQTLYLLLGSFASAEDARANAVVITNLLNGTGMFDLRLDELIAEIYRWFSLGSAQSTTLLDECARQHRDYKYNGAEKGRFVDLAEIFHYLGFLAYDDANNIVDGWRMRELRAMAAALHGENSYAAGAATIESAHLVLRPGNGRREAAAAHGPHHRRVLLRRRRHGRPARAVRRDVPEARRARLLRRRADAARGAAPRGHGQQPGGGRNRGRALQGVLRVD